MLPSFRRRRARSVAVCSTASVGCINHNVWRIYACYLYRAVFTLYRKKIIESSRGLRARELVSFAAFLLHKLYFIIFTAMLRFLSWLWRPRSSLFLSKYLRYDRQYVVHIWLIMFHLLICTTYMYFKSTIYRAARPQYLKSIIGTEYFLS